MKLMFDWDLLVIYYDIIMTEESLKPINKHVADRN